MRGFFKKILVTLPAILAMLFAFQEAKAATYTVNVFDDPAPTHNLAFPDNGCDSSSINGGRCSLREAVLASGVNGDTDSLINLPTGTYTLTITSSDDTGMAGDLDVLNHSLTITGATDGPSIIDASALGDRVFDVPSNSVPSFILNNLTIRGGTLPSTGTDGGGAIHFIGLPGTSSISINSCFIAGNSVAGSLMGGGLFATGNVNINSSTFSNDTTASAGFGGGIFAFTGTGSGQGLKINNSTISGNTSGTGGGILTFGSAVIIRSSTITQNTANPNQGGGIFLQNFGTGSALNIENSILQGNTAGSGSADCSKDGTSAAASSGFNIFGDVVSCAIPGPNPGDQTGVTNPGIGPLAFNGGLTPTHLLLSGSSAIDGGSPGMCPDANGAGPLIGDQRGQTRPIGANCDIGAVELGNSDLVVDKSIDSSTPSTVHVGDTITYDLVVTNNGPDTDFEVVLTDTLPSGGAVSFVSATADNGAPCVNASGIVTCDLGQINSGDGVTVEIAATAELVGNFTNSATAVGTENDPTPATDSVDITIHSGGGGGGCSLGAAPIGGAAATMLLSLTIGGAMLLRKRK